MSNGIVPFTIGGCLGGFFILILVASFASGRESELNTRIKELTQDKAKLVLLYASSNCDPHPEYAKLLKEALAGQ